MKTSEIVAKLKTGDKEVWNMIVDKYSKKIFNMALNFTGNSDDASDITQDIFLKIYNSINKFKEDKNLNSWILRLTKNHCIDNWRKNKKYKLKVPMNESISGGDKNPEDSAIDRYDSLIVREKLLLLNPELRLLIIMRDIQNYSYNEIAEHFNIPIGTIKSRVNRARTRLAKILLDEGK